jgi:hypothetical protein
MLGKYLEFSVYAPDVLESLGFYKALGFVELETGDVWPHQYAVVSDGDVCIGLHNRVFDAPALTFVQQDLARHARSMADHGFDFSFLRVDEDVFNELGFCDRDGHLISLVEARTFSTPADDLEHSACGGWFELTLPVRDSMHAGLFWAPLAPTLLQLREEPTTHMRFDAGGIALGLSESIALNSPALSFKCFDKDRLEDLLQRHGMKSEKFPGFEGAFRVIAAPEGTKIYLFDEDFLGEAYTVDETDASQED